MLNNQSKILFTRVSPIIVMAAAAALFFVLLVIQRPTPLVVDEHFHTFQIDRIAGGVFRQLDQLSMGPGYHIIVAALAKLAGVQGHLNAYRAISAAISIVCVLSFYLVIGSLGDTFELSRLIQMVFLPILFPFFVLVYTDVLALTMIMLMIYFHLRHKIVLSAAIALVGLIVRQTNIVWIAAWFVIQFLSDFQGGLSWDNIKGNIAKYGAKQWSYVVVFVLFGTFVVVNGGVALGSARSGEQSVFLNVDNPLFYLALHGFLFLPLVLKDLPDVARRLRRPLPLLGTICILLAYAFLTVQPHPWNQPGTPWKLLRNDALLLLNQSVVAKMIGAVAIVLGFSSFLVMKLSRREYYALYAFAAAMMCAQHLIEPRYYVPFLALFTLFRVNATVFREALLSLYWTALSVMLFFMEAFFTYLP